MSRRIASLATGAQGHQQLTLRAEFHYRVTLACRPGVFFQFPGIGSTGIYHPYIAFAVHVHAVWPDNQAGAETGEHIAIRVQLDDRIDVGHGTRVSTATVTRPNIDAIDIDIDRAHRSPAATIGQGAEVALGFIGIGSTINRLLVGMGSRLYRSWTWGILCQRVYGQHRKN